MRRVRFETEQKAGLTEPGEARRNLRMNDVELNFRIVNFPLQSVWVGYEINRVQTGKQHRPSNAARVMTE